MDTRCSKFRRNPARKLRCIDCGKVRRDHADFVEPPSRPVVTERTIVICHEKHGEVHFVVDSDEELFAVALSIVTERLRIGYWYSRPEEPKGKPDFTEEGVASLPASMREEAAKKLRAYEQAYSSYRRDLEDWEHINRCVREKDGAGAWKVLREMSDGEYARVSLEKVHVRYPKGGMT